MREGWRPSGAKRDFCRQPRARPHRARGPRGKRAAPGARVSMRKARCASAFRTPIRVNAKPSSSTPRAGSPAATVSISTFDVEPARGLVGDRRRGGKVLSLAPARTRRSRCGSMSRRAPRCAGCRRKPSCSTARGLTAASMSSSPATLRIVLAEAIVFGRSAMGETVDEGKLTDRWRVRRDGQADFRGNARLDGAIAETLAGNGRRRMRARRHRDHAHRSGR